MWDLNDCNMHHQIDFHSNLKLRCGKPCSSCCKISGIQVHFQFHIHLLCWFYPRINKWIFLKKNKNNKSNSNPNLWAFHWSLTIPPMQIGPYFPSCFELEMFVMYDRYFEKEHERLRTHLQASERGIFGKWLWDGIIIYQSTRSFHDFASELNKKSINLKQRKTRKPIISFSNAEFSFNISARNLEPFQISLKPE